MRRLNFAGIDEPNEPLEKPVAPKAPNSPSAEINISRVQIVERIVEIFPDLQTNPAAFLSFRKLLAVHDKFLQIKDDSELAQIKIELQSIIIDAKIPIKAICDVFGFIIPENKAGCCSLLIDDELKRAFARKSHKENDSKLDDDNLTAIDEIFKNLSVIDKESLKYISEKSRVRLEVIKEKLSYFLKKLLPGIKLEVFYHNSFDDENGENEPYVEIDYLKIKYKISLEPKNFIEQFSEFLKKLNVYNGNFANKISHLKLDLRGLKLIVLGDVSEETRLKLSTSGHDLEKIIKITTGLEEISVEIYYYDAEYGNLNVTGFGFDYFNTNRVKDNFVPYAKVVGLSKTMPDKFDLTQDAFSKYLQSLI